jgi:hypothetical protein
VDHFRQNLFHLRHYVVFVSQRHFEANFRINNVPRPAEVRDNGYGASGERFENYACTVVANRWKHEYISRSEVLEDFRMTEPAAKKNSLFDSKRSYKLLEAVSLWAIADHGKAGQITAQKWSRRA